ncbi:hypothetical protein [Lysinibacter sp. HNR]|uniref:hypothetical protein n=1 Tax=Lysinibacter sp. HNR TaxID=3031408 RepID=UPI0024356C2D|nr:hypothetical protein [Lysinibacter sp. HNR]WGD37106.1 hypothetical protein FrondiHNR_11800 [Lysinibacter sp. HNR]
MHRHRFLTSIGAVTAALFLLVGCGTGNHNKKTAQDSPLRSYIAQVFGDNFYLSDTDLDRGEEEVQNTISSCMASQGFEYTPYIVESTVSSGRLHDGSETLEWVQENGYGYTESNSSGSNYQGDPNEAYASTLPAAEKKAYYYALHGEQSTLVPGNEDTTNKAHEAWVYDWTKSGCHGAARHEHQESSVDPYTDPEYQDLFSKMKALYGQARSAQPVVLAAEEWRGCMADAGYPDLQEPSDALRLVSTRYASARHDGNPAATPDQQEKNSSQPDALKSYEVEVAVADFTCNEKTRLLQTQLEAQFKLEDEFIAKNRARLDAFVAEYRDK